MSNIFTLFSGGMTFISGLITILVIIGQCLLFKKAGRVWWHALIPIYNLYELVDIVTGQGWLFLLVFLSVIPFFGTIAFTILYVIFCIKLLTCFGLNTQNQFINIALAIIAGIFNGITFIIIGLSNARYYGPQKTNL